VVQPNLVILSFLANGKLVNGDHFKKTWFDEFDWLEYSEKKDAAYCLYCYLFFDPGKPEKFGSSVFAKDGYVN